MDAALRFSGIIRILARHGVDFILVGGVAAILEGAPVSTFVGETEIYEVDGSSIHTLKLAMIIRSKEEANREKDRAVLPILKRTLLLKQGPRESY